MPQVNYTPIQLYRSGTTGATPSAGLLQNGELAINYADGKLFYKDGAGVVQNTWGLNITGNAATATALQNPRTINSVSFNGTSNIVVEPYIEQDEISNVFRYLSFVDYGSSGYQRLNVDTDLKYMPSTGSLYAPFFVGTATAVSDGAISAAKLNGSQSGNAPIYAARAWVNFNGAGTVAIRASGNVSSITDHGNGDYTVNFTTEMPDTDYSAVVTAGGGGTAASGNAFVGWAAIYATSSVRIGVSDNNTDSNSDSVNTNVAIFR